MSEAKLGRNRTIKFSVPEYLRKHCTDGQRYLIIWIITGVCCGVAAVAFHKAIEFVFYLVHQLGYWIGDGDQKWFYILIGLAPMVGGILTGLILEYLEPNAAGSGIPRTKSQYYRKFGLMRLREAVYRFIVGVLSVGFGMSLGREGPTVHICSAIASKIGRWFGLARKRIQAMVPLGMGAGISAAFNTPMAAVFFVFEELLGNFSSKSFFGIFIAVVIATTVQRLLVGEHPAFAIDIGLITTDWWMLISVPLGLLSALFGRLFVRGVLSTRGFFREKVSLPNWVKPGIGGLGVGVIGVSVAWFSEGKLGVFGVGYDDLSDALNGRITVILVVALLLVGKVLATLLAYGSGGSGGLFAPTLFIGGMLGALLGLLAQPIFQFDNDVVGAMAMLGMGAFFAAVIRCPMTSIVIIWEMTGQYALILPLMIGNMIAWFVAVRFQPVPLYDSLLLQDKINLKKLPHYKGDQDWRNLPTSTIMTFDPVFIEGHHSIQDNLKRIDLHFRKHHAYPILDQRSRLVGMITHQELDAPIKVDERVSILEMIQDQNLILLKPELSIREAAKILVDNDLVHAPIVSSKDHRKLVGILTLNDITRQQNSMEDSIGR